MCVRFSWGRKQIIGSYCSVTLITLKYKILGVLIPQSLKSSLWYKMRRIILCIWKARGSWCLFTYFRPLHPLLLMQVYFIVSMICSLLCWMLLADKFIPYCLEPHLLLHIIQLYQVFYCFHCPTTVFHVMIHREVGTLPVSLSLLEMQNIRIHLYVD